MILCSVEELYQYLVASKRIFSLIYGNNRRSRSVSNGGNPSEFNPRGEQTISIVAMPSDTNPVGDIFGGWIMSQMDVAGGVAAAKRAGGRTATVAVKEMEFHKPVRVGDLVRLYAEIIKVGRTSITINIEAWADDHYKPTIPVKVTEAIFTYVAIDDDGKPRPVPEA